MEHLRGIAEEVANQRVAIDRVHDRLANAHVP